MHIHVKLHGILRDKLPVEQKGKTDIELQDGNSIADLFSHLGISRRVEIAINEEIEIDTTHVLVDGDQVHLFTAIGGG